MAQEPHIASQGEDGDGGRLRPGPNPVASPETLNNELMSSCNIPEVHKVVEELTFTLEPSADVLLFCCRPILIIINNNKIN